VSTPVPRLHAPTDDRVLARPDFLLRARALMAAGATIHLRSRALTARALLALAEQLPGCWINDRVDIARLSGAPGVHLPANGFEVSDVRGLLPSAIVGRSCHSISAARAELAGGADYVFLGSIWNTPSHPGLAPLGTKAIEIAAPVGRVVAIGGVNPDRVAACKAAGAWGVASISALWDAPDPGATARAMLLLLEV
jgi:thiamine-phosphate diphosphorylase